MTASQCRAARGLLGWSQQRLSDEAKVAVRTLISFEAEDRSPRASTIAAIRAALEVAGVEFIAENGGGAGVRLRK
ncbi:helix-turn-helix domain-containing protein [Mameliella alba]|nr:helix-turn-helix domain-containing protein [Mameliella alba]MBY6171520.1 helix-turn-helix domain-containing protein [Mameliella alba]MBY6176744.1 helix-turn-helix domain-containing protein [Mameliella alba]